MKLAVASDHAGVALKARVMEQLRQEGHEAADLGTYTTDAVDYPDYAKKVALAVLGGQAEHGVLICVSGAGDGAVAPGGARGGGPGHVHNGRRGLSGLREEGGAGGARRAGGARGADLRQRRGRVRGGEQDQGDSRGDVPRQLLGSAVRGRRRRECAVPGGAGDRSGTGG